MLTPLKVSSKQLGGVTASTVICFTFLQQWYLQPIITQYFIDNKSEIWVLFLIAHSKR